MNLSVYLFGRFAQGYSQFPADYSRSIFEVFHKNSKAISQIGIHRDGDLMYYAYIRTLDDGNYIGLCSVINGKMLTKIDSLFTVFENVIESMVRNGYLICFNNKGDIVAKTGKLYESKEEIDIISSSLRHSLEQFETSSKVLPSVNYSVSKDSLSEFSIYDNQEDILKSSCSNSYTMIYKSKGFNTILLNSYKGVIAKKEKENAQLLEEQSKLKNEVARLKNKQRNTTWVSILAIASLVLGTIVWTQVLFPSEVTKKDMGEFVYYGPMENGEPNGTGVAIYHKDDKDKRLYYYGKFVNGKRVDDNAIMFYQDGSYFKGSMSNDQWFKGTFFDVNDEHFVGEFKNNQPWSGEWYKHVAVQSVNEGE